MHGKVQHADCLTAATCSMYGLARPAESREVASTTITFSRAAGVGFN